MREIIPQDQGGMQRLGDALKAVEHNISQILPEGMSARRAVAIVYNLVERTPTLKECTISSIVRGLRLAAELGVELGSPIGEAFLVPRKNARTNQMEATFQVGYTGLRNLAYASGVVRSLEARAVYDGDDFAYSYGVKQALRHTPGPKHGSPNPSAVTAAYAIARLASGGVVFEVMTREQLDAIRRQSEASERGPWSTHYAQMACKTVLKRLCKWLPVGGRTQLAKALRLDSDAEAGIETVEFDEDLARQPAPTGTDSVKARLAAMDSASEDPELIGAKAAEEGVK